MAMPFGVDLNHFSNIATHSTFVWSESARKGLPHFEGRETTTVLGGLRQPFKRDSWMRWGFAPFW
jgi:hypothetical protein